MILNIKERLMLLGLLPLEGSLSEMVDIYDLARELKLDDNEKVQILYTKTKDGFVWDSEKDPNKDIIISNDLLSIINNQIDKLDEALKISIEHIPLILKLRNG